NRDRQAWAQARRNRSAQPPKPARKQSIRDSWNTSAQPGLLKQQQTPQPPAYNSQRPSELLGDERQHLVGGGNHLGVHFVGTLSGDHVHQLLNDADVGVFQSVLQHGAQAVESRRADLRRTAGGGFQEQV